MDGRLRTLSTKYATAAYDQAAKLHGRLGRSSLFSADIKDIAAIEPLHIKTLLCVLYACIVFNYVLTKRSALA